jgi:hypothetical protein
MRDLVTKVDDISRRNIHMHCPEIIINVIHRLSNDVKLVDDCGKCFLIVYKTLPGDPLCKVLDIFDCIKDMPEAKEIGFAHAG